MSAAAPGFGDLLEQLGLRLGLPGFTPDAHGVARLVFDDTRVVDIQDEDGAALVLITPLRPLPPEPDPDMLLNALAAPLERPGWLPGAAVAADRNARELLLVHALPLAGLDVEMLIRAVEAIIALADGWEDAAQAPPQNTTARDTAARDAISV